MKMRQLIEMSLREDSAGSGKFGARRGGRTHNGVDFVCVPGAILLSPVDGEFTKYGYCYGNDLSWRYVQLTDKKGLHHRFFYCEKMPLWEIGMQIWEGDHLCTAQDISKRYLNTGMLPHVHYEIMNDKGGYLNPLGEA